MNISQVKANKGDVIVTDFRTTLNFVIPKEQADGGISMMSEYIYQNWDTLKHTRPNLDFYKVVGRDSTGNITEKLFSAYIIKGQRDIVPY
jgi:hypothetical protein